MKVFAIDWEAFLGFLEPWAGLAPAARRLILDAKPKTTFPRRALGDELDALLEGGFVTAMSDDARVRLADAFHDAHKVLRALARHPLHLHHDARAFREYVGEHFTNAERIALVGAESWIPKRDERLLTMVTSAGHVRGLLAAKDVRAWEKESLPPRSDGSGEREWTQSRSLLKSPHSAGDLVALVEQLRDAREAIPFPSLAVPGASRARLAGALEAGLRYLVCFPVLGAELVPVLMLWPSVAERLRRPPAHPPASARPEQVFDPVLRLEDLTQLLVRAAEPLRIKHDGWTLFATAQAELEQDLLPLPDWLVSPEVFPENASERRLRAVQRLAEELGLTEKRGRAGRDLALVTSRKGLDWLAKTPEERMRVLLRGRRLDEKVAEEQEEGGGFAQSATRLIDEFQRELELMEPDDGDESDEADDSEEGGEDLDPDVGELVPFRKRSARAPGDMELFGFSARGIPTRAALRVYASLTPGSPVVVQEFLRYHAENGNPLPEVEHMPHAWSHWNPPTEEALETRWSQALCRLCRDYLLPYGGVRAGLAKGRGLTIELTPIGRHLLGLAPDFTLVAPAVGAKPVRVQPDFEIVFGASHPSFEAACSRFAERRGRGVGVLFRITRDSIASAARVGIGAEDVLATLVSASPTPVPANVEHEIRAWAARCRRIVFEPAELLRCPDEATALRVFATAGAGRLVRLAPTVLALLDPSQRAAVVRACRKDGIFLEEGSGGLATEERGARRRR